MNQQTFIKHNLKLLRPRDVPDSDSDMEEQGLPEDEQGLAENEEDSAQTDGAEDDFFEEISSI